MNPKTVTIDAQVYTVAYLTEGQFEEIVAEKDAHASNRALVASCLNNADTGNRTAEELKDIPYPHFRKLLSECLDLNGLAAKNAEAATTGQ